MHSGIFTYKPFLLLFLPLLLVLIWAIHNIGQVRVCERANVSAKDKATGKVKGKLDHPEVNPCG